jgi:6-pyruvoyltetrahydropterin/6-carboxytetrahydropterin synthase
MSISVTKEYRTETAHRLREYEGKCRYLHGHSYLWQVTAESDTGLDHRGIAVDFKDLKAAMVAVLEPFDHALVLRGDDPLATDPMLEGEPVWLVPDNPTAENFAAWAASWIQEHLPEGIRVTEVKVWETATSFATWRLGADTNPGA